MTNELISPTKPQDHETMNNLRYATVLTENDWLLKSMKLHVQIFPN